MAKETSIPNLKRYALRSKRNGKPVIQKTQITELEKFAGGCFPEILKKLFAEYGGIQLESGIEIDFKTIKERVKHYQKYCSESHNRWMKSFIEICREPDGSPYLLKKTTKRQKDAAVFRFGHGEGDDEPQPF